MANIILISITAILVRLWNLLRMHNILPNLLENLETFDRVLMPKNNKDYSRILSGSVILLVVSWPYQIYSILIVTTDNWMAFLMFYLNLYNNFSVIACEFQFVSLCWMIQTRFRAMNRGIEELYSKVLTADEELMKHKLIRLKKCYKLLIQSCSQLNKLYGFKLLIILSGLSLNVLFGLYFSIFGGFAKNSTKTSLNFQRISNVANEIIWSFYYMVRFVFICVVADLLINAGYQSRKTISNIFCNSLDENVKQELWIFLTLISTNKIRLSACGFFTINKTLVTSAVSMGTTYLVILAQFQKK
ncbi:uncharacterized protein [Leptinotarsa decemlineata]|uniref:uncharacterized protein n=1 Tax=Leptinotarsa decemlineata TaxID=7539 RepID=UPI003D309C2A